MCSDYESTSTEELKDSSLGSIVARICGASAVCGMEKRNLIVN